jgi:hypothetical protein
MSARSTLTCSCGENLDHEGEIEAGKCWNCAAEEAGFVMPQPEIPRLLTRAEIEAACGVTHRRKTA